MDKRIKQHSVVQINENFKEDWIGCIAMVDEIKSFGVLAHVKIPMQGSAYVRLKWEEIEYIGEAPLIPSDNE